MRPELRPRRVCAAVALALATQASQAAVRLDLPPLVDLGTWAPGSGDLVWSRTLCAASWRARDTPQPYAIMLAAPAFTLDHVGGGAALPVEVRWEDIATGTAFTLQPGVETPQVLSGAPRNCPGGDNARLTLTVRAADLAAAPGGVYTGLRNLRLRGGNRGNQQAQGNLMARAAVPDTIRVSGMSDIDLGLFDTVNDLVGSDRLCVYRNDTTGTYRLVASGDGVGGAFELAGPSGGQVPLTVTWNDGTGARTLLPGVPSVHVGADTAALDCGGSGSADLGVRAQATDMQGQPGGAYRGTLTITVAPI